MRTWGAAGVAGTVRAAANDRAGAESVRLKLRHTWTTTMSSSDYRDVIYYNLARDGVTGHGEGAPIVRYQESAASGVEAIRGLGRELASLDPRYYTKFSTRFSPSCPATGRRRRRSTWR